MSEEIKNPQENNNQTAQPALEEKKGQIIPTWVGVIVIIALVGAFIFLFLKFKKVSVDTAELQEPARTNQIKDSNATEQGAPAENSASAEENLDVPSGSNVNIDYELKKMDESVDAVSENDFDSNNFSNAEIGL